MGISDEQARARALGLGGSDCAPALGLSKRKSKLQLYLEKRGEAPPLLDNPWFKWGRLLEPVIIDEYSKTTGRQVITPDTMHHPKYPFVLGHPDGCTDDKRVLEVKTARNAEGWGEEGSDEVPSEYLMQVQHYMLLTGYFVADVVVLIGGSDFRIYEVPADRELQGMIIEGESAFWQRVQAGDPPDPDFDSVQVTDTLKLLFPGTNGRRAKADDLHETWYRIWNDSKERASHYDAVATGAKAHLLYELGEGSELQFSDGYSLVRKITKRAQRITPASEFMTSRFVKTKDE